MKSARAISVWKPAAMGSTLLFLAGALLYGGCGGSTPSSPTDLDGGLRAVYPMYVDDNGNGVNDYVEPFGHDPGSPALAHAAPGRAVGGHPYRDGNGDGICDYAQNASNTWHGPGFVDRNGNGICDYWDEESPLMNTHQGQQFRHRYTEEHRVRNAWTEMPYHGGDCGHPFVDTDGDGICDRAEDGSCAWHGPGFVDRNGNGICDHYDENGGGRPRYRYEHEIQIRNEEHTGAGSDADLGPDVGPGWGPDQGEGEGGPRTGSGSGSGRGQQA